MDEDSSMEQKTWQVYSFGGKNVFKLCLNESRGDCLSHILQMDNSSIITAMKKEIRIFHEMWLVPHANEQQETSNAACSQKMM